MDASDLYLAASIPAFFLLIALELAVQARRGDRAYRLADSITNLSCGVGSILASIATNGAVIAIYVLVYDHLRVFTLSAASPWTWLVALLGVDLGYYWFHRHSHRINIFWAGHVAHHQSEEYNLSVALRQSWYVPFFVWAYYAPMLLLGVPPSVVLLMRTLNTLYQFWIHTETIRRLGPLEWFLNTPSHHRVHHGVNPEYLDRNYAGIFIVWDKLFGTFEPEGREVVYGLVRPLRSFNPLWANVHRFAEMAEVARRTRRWRDKLRIWFSGPEWLPEDCGGVKEAPQVTRAEQQKYDVPGVSAGLKGFVLVNFALVALATTALLYWQRTLATGTLLAIGFFIGGALIAWGGWFERKSWAMPLELARWASGLAAAALVSWGTPYLWPVLLGAATVALANLLWATLVKRVDVGSTPRGSTPSALSV